VDLYEEVARVIEAAKLHKHGRVHRLGLKIFVFCVHSFYIPRTMDENDPNVEITPVEESEQEAFAPAKSGGEASVTLRLLTQEEFDRLQAEKNYKPKE
jgi:hypothetical protein